MKKTYLLLIALALTTGFAKLSAQTLESDSLALVDFYNAAGGPSWTDQGNWLTGAITTWSNIKVDTLDNDATLDSIRVTELTVSLNNMSGTISPSIGSLTELTKLEIKGDEKAGVYVDITGSIPSELWNCTKIYRLQLKFTKLTGDIPTNGIGNMTALQEVNFQGTKLACELPEELFNLPSLKQAYLHQSEFKGALPSSLSNATNLTRLYLHGNKLEGPLPFVDLPASNAAKVNLNGNYFSIDDVKPYHDAKANYAGFTDEYQYAQPDKNFTLVKGDSVAFEFYAKGGEDYFWFYRDNPDMISTDTLYSISSVEPGDTGTYTCKVQTNQISNFEIWSIFTIDTVKVLAAPKVQSVASSEDGTKVSLTFDLDMADPSAEAANFSFTEGGTAITVSSAALDGSDAKIVVLTLETAISSGAATLEVSYTPGDLKSAEGGRAEAFGPVSVTNNYITAVGKTMASDIKAYPNPFNDFVTITSSSELRSYRIMDITGKTVMSQNNLSGTTLSLPVHDINSGIYFISVESEGSTFVQKITKKQ